jgi:ferredoxin
LISAETLWSCTTCLACVEACPVAIEHVPTIVGMRRSLVDQGLVEPGLQTAFTSLAKQGNSFGQSGRARAKWTDGLATPIRDARVDEVDWLWFVGDFASFDLRVQEATRLVARVLQAADVDFGILHEGERNAGNDVRRAGEEGLFEMLVEHNVGQLAKARFRRIVTTDPHTLNTLRHEYPQFGAEYEVWHYTQLLAALFRDGHLAARRPVGRWVTYHDPCYLARYVEVTAAPREVLRAIGAWLVEVPRKGEHVRGLGGADLDGRFGPARAALRAADPRGCRPGGGDGFRHRLPEGPDHVHGRREGRRTRPRPAVHTISWSRRRSTCRVEASRAPRGRPVLTLPSRRVTGRASAGGSRWWPAAIAERRQAEEQLAAFVLRRRGRRGRTICLELDWRYFVSRTPPQASSGRWTARRIANGVRPTTPPAARHRGSTMGWRPATGSAGSVRWAWPADPGRVPSG